MTPLSNFVDTETLLGSDVMAEATANTALNELEIRCSTVEFGVVTFAEKLPNLNWDRETYRDLSHVATTLSPSYRKIESLEATSCQCDPSLELVMT